MVQLNHEQFNNVLLHFQKAVDEKEYATRIPYKNWRIFVRANGAIITFTEQAVVVSIDDDTVFEFDKYDNGFGQFLDGQLNNNKKENDTMKIPTMNFDFGPFTEPNVVALSPYGIAIRDSKGSYLTYNPTTGSTVDVTGFTFDFQKMPAAIKDLRAGDMVMHRSKPMYVQSVEEDGIHRIDILNSEAKVIVPVTSIFGFNYVTKVVSLMNFNATQPSAENPFGNLMPFMMMSSIMDDDSDNDFSKMMMMSMMMGGSNPFTAMFNAGSKA